MMMLSMVSSASLKSLRFAPATTMARGMPLASVSKLRLVPRLARSVGFGRVLFHPAAPWSSRHPSTASASPRRQIPRRPPAPSPMSSRTRPPRSTPRSSEFHTLNRCLDNAIAGAVSSRSQERDRTLAHKTDKASDTARRDLGRLLEQAKTAFDVIRGGRVGAGGATGTILQLALAEMGAIIHKVGCASAADYSAAGAVGCPAQGPPAERSGEAFASLLDSERDRARG